MADILTDGGSGGSTRADTCSWCGGAHAKRVDLDDEEVFLCLDCRNDLRAADPNFGSPYARGI